MLKQKRKPVYLDKNGKVCFSKSFICKSILEIMVNNSKRYFKSSKAKTWDPTVKDPKYFYPTLLYNDLSDYFDAFYSKRIDKNTFYIAIYMLEEQKKLKRIKIKKTLYYKLL